MQPIVSLSRFSVSSTSASVVASLSAAESCRRAPSTLSAVSSSHGSRARASQSDRARVLQECLEKLASNVRHVNKYRPRCAPANRPRSLRVPSNGGRTYHTTLPCKPFAEGVVRTSSPTVRSSQLPRYLFFQSTWIRDP